jgi:nucleoside phosphorylase
MGEHNIVIASLPSGKYGTTAATETAKNIISSLPQIRIGLLVGIGGAISRPDQGRDIRLGDIVVSQPEGTSGGVVQYDLMKARSNQAWERKGSLNKPPEVLLHALGRLQAYHIIQPSIVPDLLQSLQAKWADQPRMKKKSRAFMHQGLNNDRLFKTKHDHVGEAGTSCTKCDASWEIQRDQRDTTDPEIHYGIIASGNILIKDAATRDRFAEFTGEKALCFEMEAAGIMDSFPCLVIRGICDYADSHKNNQWQQYAAAVAAAYAKELLVYVPVYELHASQQVGKILGLS